MVRFWDARDEWMEVDEAMEELSRREEEEREKGRKKKKKGCTPPPCSLLVLVTCLSDKIIRVLNFNFYDDVFLVLFSKWEHCLKST